MAKLNLSARRAFIALSVMRHAMSTDKTRPHINGVLIRVRGDSINYVATDGHWLVMIAEGIGSNDEGDHDIRLSSDAVNRIVRELQYIDEKKPGGGLLNTVFTFDEENGQYHHILGTVKMELPGAMELDPFLSYHKIIPDPSNMTRSPGVIGISASLFKKVMAAFEEASPGSGGVCPVNILLGNSPRDPVLISSVSYQGLIAVVMPCRTGDGGEIEVGDETRIKLPDHYISADEG